MANTLPGRTGGGAGGAGPNLGEALPRWQTEGSAFRLRSLVQEWFERLGAPTEPQLHGWQVIRAGEDVLISAPTGSGKTLAAFLICIDSLIRRARTGELPDHTEVVYCSPLKALSNDVHKNLEAPGRDPRAG